MNPSPSITVLLVDDDPTARKEITYLLRPEPDIVLVGEAADGLEAISMASILSPQVILMDIRMPNLDGVEATDRICQGSNAPKIIMLTEPGDEGFVIRALGAGAKGVLPKSRIPEAVVAAIRAASTGQTYNITV